MLCKLYKYICHNCESAAWLQHPLTCDPLSALLLPQCMPCVHPSLHVSPTPFDPGAWAARLMMIKITDMHNPIQSPKHDIPLCAVCNASGVARLCPATASPTTALWFYILFLSVTWICCHSPQLNLPLLHPAWLHAQQLRDISSCYFMPELSILMIAW